MSASSAQSFDWFADLVRSELHIAEDLAISPEMSLTDDLMFDSVGMFELVLLVESLTDSVLPDTLIASLVTVGDVYGWYEQLATR